METVAREDGELKRVELSDEILRVLKELSPTQRDVVILHFFYDFKLREIAKMTNVPMSTVKSRMKQGMDKMKKYYGTLNREVGVEKRERI